MVQVLSITNKVLFFLDISELSNILQDGKALKERVSTICRKYVKHFDSKGGMTAIEDETENKKAFEEIMRQKAFLERYVPQINLFSGLTMIFPLGWFPVGTGQNILYRQVTT